MEDAKVKIGFIGLGIMGSRMAANLLHRDYELIVFNRTRAKADSLVKQGATLAESPAQLGAEVDVLFTMLSDPQAVEHTALGPEGFLDPLRPATTWIDCSTVNPSFSKKIAAEAAQRRVRFLDAPVSGSAPVAAAKQLTFWVGGEPSDVDAVQWLLLYIGSRIVHMGPNGAGSAMKLVVNLLMGATMAAFAEATTLGESLGLSRNIILDALTGMPQVAPFLITKRNKIDRGDFQAEFPLAWMQKDLHLAAASGFESGAALPVTNSAKELYRLAMRQGYGREDFSAIYAFLAANGETGSATLLNKQAA
jgi:3-hydroxyisobutyrate dehydrogenase/glyoxylate/succinic semialdehyde reductase